MEKKAVYSIFPASTPAQQSQQHRDQQKPRQSTDSRSRSSLDLSPYPPPSSPLPPVPKSQTLLDTSQIPSGQQLPPTPDSLRPVQLPLRRRASPNREFADFQRELALTSTSSSRSISATSPARGRPRSPRERLPPTLGDRPLLDTHNSQVTAASSDPDMHPSTISTSSASFTSLQKPPLLSPTTTVAPSPLPSQSRHPQHRPGTVYFHGGLGGAGNYRKVVSEGKKAPRAYAPNAEPLRRASPTRFLSNVFGGKQKAKGAEGVDAIDDRASVSEGSFRDEVDLGAAEALRRKMLSVGRRKKNAS